MRNSKPMDLTGHRYGKLIPVKLMPAAPGKKTRWLCKCMGCGGDHVAHAANLRRGDTTQCAKCRNPFEWDAKTVQAALDLREAGKSQRQIAEELGCKREQVRRKFENLQRNARRVKERVADKTDTSTPFRQYMNSPCERNCLRCGKRFEAASRMNRLCYSCNGFAQDAAPA